jgi:hypothetical protein
MPDNNQHQQSFTDDKSMLVAAVAEIKRLQELVRIRDLQVRDEK